MSDLPRSYVVTGAASGIGAAVTVLLRSQGHRVVTVDLRDADVVADLSTSAGRGRQRRLRRRRHRRPAPPLKPEGMQVNPIALGILDKVASVATRLKALRARP